MSNDGDLLMSPAVRAVCVLLQQYDSLNDSINTTKQIIERDYPDASTLGHQMFKLDLEDYNEKAKQALQHLRLAYHGLSDAGKDSFVYVRREMLQRLYIQLV
ncbi:hypothetical protein N7495_009903 [Penicillium taxi]|uniref:uncharacterized protein n=1 Tax=Penicillium taxi TaxID=168475 RepID=UPI002544F6E8|nr:uncharacterized protein N7495_009903 [Penicillium taxi]KAJ5885393.1 hypothetical protein N7495_009903 [Penicillium taxi]